MYGVGDKAQQRLLSLAVVAMFMALKFPLKKLVAEVVPGKRGPREDVAEALIQGAARTAAVIIASTLVRGLVGQEGSDADLGERKDRNLEEGTIEVSLEL